MAVTYDGQTLDFSSSSVDSTLLGEGTRFGDFTGFNFHGEQDLELGNLSTVLGGSGSDRLDFLYFVPETTLGVEYWPGDLYVDAGAGDDSVVSGKGDDQIFGGSGDDSINGNDGSDTLYGGDGADTLAGAGAVVYGHITTGGSLIFGDEGDDLIVAGVDNTIDGGSGLDVLEVGDDAILDLASGVVGSTSFSNVEGANLGSRAIAFGDDGDNYFKALSDAELHGGGGNDTLLATTGHLYGDGGDDVIFVNPNTTVDGGAGADEIELTPTNHIVKLGTGSLDGHDGMLISVENVRASTATSTFNELYGDDVGNALWGEQATIRCRAPVATTNSSAVAATTACPGETGTTPSMAAATRT